MTHKIVVGLGFGDETKGATVDWITANEDIKAVIRYNGGPQAAHNVVTPDGKQHTFAQFGAGTFNGVPTHISRFMMFNPFNLFFERNHLIEECGLPDPLENFTVSWNSLLITPYHQEANRRREDSRGGARHGSTGQGIGEVRYYQRDFPGDELLVGDIQVPTRLLPKLRKLRDHYISRGFDMSGIMEPEELAEQYFKMREYIRVVSDNYTQKLLDSGNCVFEGAQGVLLDELYGFNPHTTFTNTTQANARTLLMGRDAETWGITRTYHTRHGAGPLPTENMEVTLDDAPELHNDVGHYQGGFRVGALDLSLLRYAVAVNGGVDKMVVSHMDYLTTHEALVSEGYNYNIDDREFTWLERSHVLRIPANREQSHEYGPLMFRAKPVIRGTLEDENTVEDAIRTATGVIPTMYAYGPTREDRVNSDVLAAA